MVNETFEWSLSRPALFATSERDFVLVRSNYCNDQRRDLVVFYDSDSPAYNCFPDSLPNDLLPPFHHHNPQSHPRLHFNFSRNPYECNRKSNRTSKRLSIPSNLPIRNLLPIPKPANDAQTLYLALEISQIVIVVWRRERDACTRTTAKEHRRGSSEAMTREKERGVALM